MSTNRAVVILVIVTIAGFGFVVPSHKPQAKPSNKFTKAQIEHGAYLVKSLGGCSDCHTPSKMTANGPVPDMNKYLSGFPAGGDTLRVPQGAMGSNGWGMLATPDFTSYAGPWGISYAANITPDSATGIGSWTKEMFIKCVREGKYWGSGRPLLPPMPWEGLGRMTNGDLTDIYAYLRSIKPISNQVPAPVPPEKAVQH